MLYRLWLSGQSYSLQCNILKHISKKLCSFLKRGNFVFTYITINIDLRNSFTGQPYKLSGIKGSNHHLSRFLYNSESFSCTRVITILNSFYLTKYLFGNSSRLSNDQRNKIMLNCIFNTQIM